MVTLPPFPRPDQDRIQAAMKILFQISGNLAPGAWIQDDTLVRAALFRNATVAEAVWAIHELTLSEGFHARWTFESGVCLTPIGLIMTSKPPAGIPLATGQLRLWAGPGCKWGGLVFSPNHEKLAELRSKPKASDAVADLVDSPGQNSTIAASAAKLFLGLVPKNSNLVDLIVQLDAQKDSGRSMNEIAYKLMNGNKSKAQSLLAQVRRMKKQGKLRK